jgi:predicted metal-dependent hydrolase
MAAALKLGSIPIEIVRKDIKNVHLSVLPPNGAVRMSVPRRMTDAAVRAFAISKLSWIKQNQKRLVSQEREPPREFLDRESHYVWGRRYLLKLVETQGAPVVALKHRILMLHAKPDLATERRQEVLAAWYREQLRAALPPVIAKWERLLGVRVERVFVQQMKTKWGSANPKRRFIRLNTELAKKPPEHLDYVVLHEIAHFLSPRHDDRFRAVLDRHLPNWPRLRQELNQGPLRQADRSGAYTPVRDPR